ncbi:Uncharacterised protein [Escherichia coli]|nr:Uncharacterised protein [Escherichia coli]
MRAGTPAAVVCGGTGCSTTEPAPIFAPRPTSILPRIFRARANHHTFTNFRMTVATRFTRTAKRHRLQNRYVVFNHPPFHPQRCPGVVKHDNRGQFLLPGEYQPGTLQKPGFAERLPVRGGPDSTASDRYDRPARHENLSDITMESSIYPPPGRGYALPEYHRPQKAIISGSAA